MVVHARGYCSKGALKERIASVQLEANSDESILKIFLKRILHLSQDHLSIRVVHSNTQIVDATSFTNREVNSVLAVLLSARIELLFFTGVVMSRSFEHVLYTVLITQEC